MFYACKFYFSPVITLVVDEGSWMAGSVRRHGGRCQDLFA